MVVITMTNCPEGLRGDLTKWLLEISAGVFVGRLSARVRDRVWERVRSHVQAGRATMVFSASNEQGLDFRVAHSAWRPVDFDGLQLILRPREGGATPPAMRLGYSKASRYRMARKMTGRASRGSERRRESRLASYVVLDVETTGLSPERDRLLELSALRIRDGEVAGVYSSLIRSTGSIPEKIAKMTGIYRF